MTSRKCKLLLSMVNVFINTVYVQCIQVVPYNYTFVTLSDELHSHGFRGDAYHQGEHMFDVYRLTKNGECNHIKPWAIVRPKDTKDVSTVIKVIRKLNLPISVRSGGHSYICQSTRAGTVQIDLRRLNIVKHVGKAGYNVSIIALTAFLCEERSWI